MLLQSFSSPPQGFVWFAPTTLQMDPDLAYGLCRPSVSLRFVPSSSLPNILQKTEGHGALTHGKRKEKKKNTCMNQ
jgi:hypothetical protein